MNKEEMMNKIAKMECEIEYLKKELNKEESKKSRWKPEKNYEEYYCISTTGDVKCLVFKNDNIDNQNYEFHNMFKTKEEAEFTVEQRKVLAELKEYADDDKEWDGDNWHWCIEYNANEKRIKVDYY